ncbi:hypothetical protein D3C75_1295990 [compost metagenome]
MWADGIVRLEGFGDKVRILRFDANIDVLAVIAERPAVEGAILHRGDVIGHQVAADVIALVDGGP